MNDGVDDAFPVATVYAAVLNVMLYEPSAAPPEPKVTVPAAVPERVAHAATVSAGWQTHADRPVIDWPLVVTSVLIVSEPTTLFEASEMPEMYNCAERLTVTATVADSVAAAKFVLAAEVAVTVMTAEPAATAVMTPVDETVATDGAVVP